MTTALSARPDVAAYLQQMETLLGLTLDDARRQELLAQFSRIDGMAAPLMAFPLDEHQEIAGVYQL
ncbi:oxalurate catabolism protein HpxX [Affinibrenneria salicis]|uniref:Oxalurate catabolism protein HpxX n=1 Tax=Affinibrenneria salicis TaxID=2590031 RepID=A0A5J5FS12_9GAMM|nr:oxalurate catabolism protein HpxX [Affinibrenneria salicis]KAA8995624.1 oxalurate catabolism protein HpxX [Affinibrenneria salicis]